MEHELAKKAKFDELYQCYVKLVYKTALNYSNNNNDVAQDIVQDTFLRLYINLDTVDLTYIGSWLRIVAQNAAINYYNKSGREVPDGDIMQKVEGQHSEESAEDVFWRTTFNDQKAFLNREIFRRMYEVNPSWYQAATLVYCLGIPQKEVAKEMNISLNVLHSKLYRVRQWVIRNYEDEFDNVKQV